MSRFLSLSSQRSSCGALTRCVSCLESLCADDGASGMNEVGLALSISRACSIGCSSVDPLDSITSLRRMSECDERNWGDKSTVMVKGRALGIASCLIRWGKHLSTNVLFKQTWSTSTECSQIEQFLGLTPGQTIELLKQAADLGDSFAVFILGMCSWYGHVVPQNKEDSVKLYQQASDLGDSDAMFSLAICYWKGDGVSHDQAKAVHFFQQAAGLNHAHAMVYLGYCFKKGFFVPQSMKRATRLFQQAADFGDTFALFTLAYCFEKDGVLEDKSKANQLFRQISNWMTVVE